MAKENPFPAGTYELLGSWDKLVSKKGEPDDFVRYEAGDVVNLNAEEAERLAGAQVPAAQKPGEAQRRRAAALQAQADLARAQADAADAKVKAAQVDAQQQAVKPNAR